MSDRDNTLLLLTEEIEKLVESGSEVDADALASKYNLEVQDVIDCEAALRTFSEVFDEEPEAELSSPDLPNDYELLGELGRGGMGVVYRARQKSLDRPVAVKVLRPGELMFGDAIRRFEKEAKNLAKLRHPHIVNVYEVGRAGSHVFFSMDLIEGGSLADRIREQTLTPTEAVRILTQVADAITYTHSRGIVHRDLKPENILIDEKGNAFVVDFGLARDTAVKSSLTASGHILGTPAYMSPEQARGDNDRIGEATDVYALGAILYECLTGRSPFAGMPLVEQIHAVIYDDPVRPAKRNPQVPRALEAICLKAIEKEPNRRYLTVKALLEDLQAFVEGRTIRARSPSPISPALRFARRHRLALGAGASALLVVAALVNFLVLPYVGSSPANRITTADELMADGKHEAAGDLYAKALEDLAGQEKSDLYRQAHRGVAASKMFDARALMRGGKLNEALALMVTAFSEADAVFGYEGWPEKPSLMFDRIRCLYKMGDKSKATGLLRDFYKSMLEEARQVNKEAPWSDQPVGIIHTGRGYTRLFSAAIKEGDSEIVGWVYLSATSALEADWGPDISWAIDMGVDAVPALLSVVSQSAELNPDRKSPKYAWDRLQYEFGRLKGTDLEDELYDGLSRIVLDEDAPLVCRHLALLFLVKPSGIPYLRDRGTSAARGMPRVDLTYANKQVELRRNLRDKDIAAALKIRLDLAFEIGARGWIKGYTGRDTSDKAWWEQNRDRDPRGWLKEQYDLPRDADLGDVFKAFEKADNTHRYPLHLLLSLMCEPDRQAPQWTFRTVPPAGLTQEWQRMGLAPADTRPRQIRIAIVERSIADDSLSIIAEERIIAPIGGAQPLRMKWRARSGWSVGLKAPGLGKRRSQRRVAGGGIELKWLGERLRLDIGPIEERTLPSGEKVATVRGAVNSGQDAAYISCEDFWFIDHHSKTAPQLMLFSVDLPGEDDRQWTLADWRQKLVKDMDLFAEKLADGLPKPDYVLANNRKYYMETRTVESMSTIAGFLGVGSGSLPAMRLLRERGGSLGWGYALMARPILLAGDVSLMDSQRTMKRLVDDKAFWARLYLYADKPKIREYALSQIRGWDEIPLVLKSLLASGIDEGDASAPDWLRERVAWGELSFMLDRMGWEGVAGIVVGILAFIAALACVPFAVKGSVRCSAVLVLTGLTCCSLDLFHGSWDYLPDTLGFAFAAAGSFIIARRQTWRFALIAPVAFLLAMVSLVVGLVVVTGLLAAAAVHSLTYVVSQKIVRRGHIIFYSVPVLLYWLYALQVAITGRAVYRSFPPRDLVEVATPIALIAVAWAVKQLFSYVPESTDDRAEVLPSAQTVDLVE